MDKQIIKKVTELLDVPDLYTSNTYAFTVNGDRLFRQRWEGGRDIRGEFVCSVSLSVLEQIKKVITEAEGETLEQKEGFHEKLIENYRVLNISISSPDTINFYRQGTEGFPWPEIKQCMDNKWPFVVTQEMISYLDGGTELKKISSGATLLQDVKSALHRNQKRFEQVKGIYEGENCYVSSYTLTNGDNVLFYIYRASVMEIRYLPITR
ncbi:hypothetical protein [Paenibacillus rhizoplanae]|uniref:Uncharacterized protein n=1 Tax=Paenibacillus rhizoplanae TaxID=1917181 RepID=A0ABW5F9D0_9BACL